MDLYVLERAFASTHPDSEPMFASVLEAYGARMGKEWPALRRRLDDGENSPSFHNYFASDHGSYLRLFFSSFERS